MADTQETAVTDQGALTEAQLYGGSFDPDTRLLLHRYSSPAGEIALGIALGPGKNGPVEDSAGIIPFNEHGLVLVVADGVGSLPTGWKASGIVLEHVQAEVAKADVEDAKLRAAVLDGIESANKALRELGTGTATTLVVAIVRDNLVRTFHIGDSSAWICGQRGAVKLQTMPHSPIGMAREAGFVDETEALHHEDLNRLVRHRLVEMRVEVGSYQSIAPRDTLLIASDGLFDNVLESEIIELIRTGSVDDGLLKLWELTSKRMAGAHKGKPSKPDDFSAILFRPATPSSG